MKKLLALTLVLALGLAFMYFIDSANDRDLKLEKRLSNHAIMEDGVVLKTGDKFSGEIIGQTETAVLLKPLVYQQHDRAYTFKYDEIRSINYDDTSLKRASENPLLFSYYEIQTFKTDIQTLYNNRQFEKLERTINQLRENKARFSTGEWKLDSFYTALNDLYANQHVDKMLENLQYLEHWKKAFPDSITPIVVIIESRTDIAWEYRGSTFSGGVTATGLEKFKSQLTLILEIIKQTESHSIITDPRYYRAVVTVYKGLGFLPSEIASIVKSSIDYDPLYYTVYTGMAPFLLPRWGGYPGGIEAYANWVALQSGTEEMYARVVEKIKSYTGASGYKKFNFEWDRIQTGFDKLLQKYPNNLQKLHSYAWMACFYGDYQTARKFTNRIGFIWHSDANKVWQKFENYFDCYQLANQAEEEQGVILEREIRVGNYDNFVKLIAGEIDLNQRNSYGETAFFYAVRARFNRFALALIEAGADVNILNSSGEHAIHKAAKNDTVVIINRLLDKGVPVNSLAGSYLWSPLHYAVRHGRLNSIKRLLAEKDIGVNIKNNRGRTALHIAVINGSAPVVTLLLVHHRTNVNQVDNYNNTALNLAQEFGYSEIEKLLMEAGANANAVVVSDSDLKRSNGYHKEGQAVHAAGNYKKARQLYQKVLDINPFNYGAYANMALLDMHDGQYADCLNNANRALSFNLNYSHAIYTAWQCAYLGKKPEEEYLSYAKRYVKLNPDNFRTKELYQKYPELKDGQD